MTATTHIAAPPQHHRPNGLRARWAAFTLRHSRRAQTALFAGLHDALPLDDPDRHALDAPAIEDAFARLAIDHPDAVTADDGGQTARDADREQQLIAACDAWFRDIHGPQHRWDAATLARYARLIAGVHGCFHPGGER
jgi:hypothetical protein